MILAGASRLYVAPVSALAIAISAPANCPTLPRFWMLKSGAVSEPNGGEEVGTLGRRYEFSKSISANNSVAFFVLHEYRNYPLSAYRNGPFIRTVISTTRQFDAGLSVSGGIQSESSQPVKWS